MIIIKIYVLSAVCMCCAAVVVLYSVLRIICPCENLSFILLANSQFTLILINNIKNYANP